MNHLYWQAERNEADVSRGADGVVVVGGGDLATQWAPSSAVSMGAPFCKPLSSFRSTWLAAVPHTSKSEESIGWIYAQMKTRSHLDSVKAFGHKRCRCLPFKDAHELCGCLRESTGQSIFAFNNLQVRHDALVGHMIWWRLTWLCITVRGCIHRRSYFCMLVGHRVETFKEHISWGMFLLVWLDCAVFPFLFENKERNDWFARVIWGITSQDSHGRQETLFISFCFSFSWQSVFWWRFVKPHSIMISSKSHFHLASN